MVKADKKDNYTFPKGLTSVQFFWVCYSVNYNHLTKAGVKTHEATAIAILRAKLIHLGIIPAN